MEKQMDMKCKDACPLKSTDINMHIFAVLCLKQRLRYKYPLSFALCAVMLSFYPPVKFSFIFYSVLAVGKRQQTHLVI